MTTTFDWSAVAPGWDRLREHAGESTAPVSVTVLERLALRPGDSVLELGSGTGDLALRLAEQVGPTGAVLATDVAAGMVELCQGSLADVPQAEVRLVDAAATGLPDAGFDAVAFVMGLMFVVEQEQVAQEIRRVLRPGGRAVVATWAGPEHNPWLAGLGMAAMAHGVVAGGPPTQPGGLFSLAEEAALEAALRAGGFADVTVEQVPVMMRYPDAEAWLDTVSTLAGPLAVALAARPDAAEAVRATAVQFVSSYQSAEGLALPGRALVAHATR